MSNGWTALIKQEINLLPDDPKNAYLKREAFSKFVGPDTDPANVRRQRAINKWLATERENEATNVRLATIDEGFHILPHLRYSTFVSFASKVIEEILGATVPEEALIGQFSGGASTSRSRTESHPASKFTGQADITSAAIPWFNVLKELCPGWLEHPNCSTVLREVPGNVLFTVPKTTDIDRCAAKEPDINMFLQKGLGSYIRSRLRRVGIDLNDQSRNQRLARQGSILGDLATLDLSSASDSISRELVFQLLPSCWFAVLDEVRSPITIIDGEEHVNEMFSSMGNGFTFELESLLFYALARATAYFKGIRGVISVYGDDIIVPTDVAADLQWVLKVFGFSVNSTKSFSEGPFRESCGGHYYNGVDITPFYVRKPITKLIDLIHVANAIRRWSASSMGILSPELEPLWLLLRDEIPRQFWGGRELGDTSQLVTPHNPKRKLVAMERRMTTTTGGYFHWLSSTWVRERQSDAVVCSELSRVGTRYRARPARLSSVHQQPDPFYTELEDAGGKP